MKKSLIYLLFIIALIITFSGCSKNSLDRNSNSNQQVAAPKNTNDKQEKINADISMKGERNTSSERYISYNEIISEFMNRYKNLYTDTNTMKMNIRTVTGEMNIESTEGNSALKYLDPDGTVLRYNIVIFGETGKRIIDYYVLEDKLYAVDLRETYSSPILGVGGDDVLCYDLTKYMIDGNELYCLDDAAKITITENNTDALLFMTLEELDHNFMQTDTDDLE